VKTKTKNISETESKTKAKEPVSEHRGWMHDNIITLVSD